MLRFLIPIVVLLAALITLVLLDRGSDDAEFVIASENEVFTLDPQRMSWLTDMRMAYALFEGLVRWNTDDFSIEPAVATSWTTSPDGLTWRFELDESARWSDGSPVTAHDFVWSWKRLLSPDTAADYSGLLFDVLGAREFWDWRNDALASFDPSNQSAESLMDQTDSVFAETVGIRAIGDHTLEIELAQPVPYLLDLLAFAPLLPVHRPTVEGWILHIEDQEVLRQNGWDAVDPPAWEDRQFASISPETGRLTSKHSWARPELMISNGPYILDEWRYRRDLRLAQNPNARSHRPGSPRSILIRSYPDPNTALLAFDRGDLDWLTGVSADVRRDLLDAADEGGRDDERLVRSIHAVPAYGTDFFSFNCRPELSSGANNPFHNPLVRRAFALATDKQAIVDHVTGLREPIASVLTPQDAIVGYEPPDGLGFDPVMAVAELASAGWTRNTSGELIDESGRPFPPVELLYTTSSARHRRIAAALRSQWQQLLGVDVHLVGKDSKAFSVDLRAGNFMIARGRWYGDWGDPTTFLELFRSTDGNNDRGFNNPDIDARLDTAKHESDTATRMRQLRSIEHDIFNLHMPLLPICQIVEVTMHDPADTSGMTSHPRLIQYLGDVTCLREEP
jgi:oligopeptide transport system substrate-binding protein